MTKSMRPRDPVELAIFSNLVAAVAEEACSALERTAYTTFVKEANDFAVALADPSGTFFAYPRKSGVTTFIVNQNGIVYQKDLGPDTEKIANAMTEYDPDSTWERVD